MSPTHKRIIPKLKHKYGNIANVANLRKTLIPSIFLSFKMAHNYSLSPICLNWIYQFCLMNILTKSINVDISWFVLNYLQVMEEGELSVAMWARMPEKR